MALAERFMEEGVLVLLRNKMHKSETPSISATKVGELMELERKPPTGGETNWTVRALAAKVGVGVSTAHGISALHKPAPHRQWDFTVSTEGYVPFFWMRV